MSLARVILAPPERKELERRARSRSLAVELVRRAKVILMLAAGRSYSEISERLRCTDRYISHWKERLSKSDCSAWIRVTAELSTAVARLRPKLAFWN